MIRPTSSTSLQRHHQPDHAPGRDVDPDHQVRAADRQPLVGSSAADRYPAAVAEADAAFGRLTTRVVP